MEQYDVPADLPGIRQPGPLMLQLGLQGTVLACSRAVRVVPGKRVVCQAVWQQQAVYAKLFIGKGAARYATRDRSGVDMLQQAGILTPPLLHAGQLDDGSAEVLVFAEIIHSQNLEQAWQALPLLSLARRDIALRLVAEVARHHAAGLVQTDLYLKNFLIGQHAQQGEQLFTLDGDGMRRLTGWRTQSQMWHNLALLLSKLDVLELTEWLPTLAMAYVNARPQAAVPTLDWLQNRALQLRRRMLRQYADHKVLRECTDVHVLREAGRYAAYNRAHASAALQMAMADPDALLPPDVPLLKRGHTCTVAKFALDGEEMVIKRYNIKSFWHGLGRAWRQSRAVLSWRNAHRLQLADMLTPRPMALVELRPWGLRGLAYFVADYVHAPDALAFFADATIASQDKAEAAMHIARLFRRLHLLGISHGDCKASNVLVQGLQPCLIDLDAMRQHRSRFWFERQHVRDLRRLMRNWQHDPATVKLLSAAFASMDGYNPILARAGISIKR